MSVFKDQIFSVLFFDSLPSLNDRRNGSFFTTLLGLSFVDENDRYQ